MESVEFLGRYRLTQSDACFKLGRDSVLLARFCTLRPRWSVCDLGCGVGSLLLLLSQREEALDRVGVELDPVAAGLARRNLSDNGLEGQVLTGDLRDRALLKGDRFQLVIANPPYFRAGSGKSGGQARMDDTCPVDDLCRAAGRLAKTGVRRALHEVECGQGISHTKTAARGSLSTIPRQKEISEPPTITKRIVGGLLMAGAI